MSSKGQIAAIAYSAAGSAALLCLYAVLDGHAVNQAVVMFAAVFHMLVLLPAAWLAGKAYDRMRKIAMQDDLTRTWNRKFVTEAMPKLMRQAGKRRKPLSVSLIDINDFKLINDSYGHQAGDQALQLIAGALRGCAGKGEIVARWGGDEFLFISPCCRTGQQISNEIGQALDKLSKRIGTRVTASVGTAVFPEDGDTLQALLHHADRRMYDDKENRKRGYDRQTMLQA
jgi:diguanylate cyclase (GGDEF)-like protein